MSQGECLLEKRALEGARMRRQARWPCIPTIKLAWKYVNFDTLMLLLEVLAQSCAKRSFSSRSIRLELYCQRLAKTGANQPARRGPEDVNLPQNKLLCRLAWASFLKKGNRVCTCRRSEVPFSASEDLARFRNILLVLKESLWSQTKNECLAKIQSASESSSNRLNIEHIQNALGEEK